jgi:Predicted solute binding protein
MSVRKGGFLYFAALLLLAALLLMPNAMPVFASPEQFPVNKYGWLDTIVFFGEKDRSKAINMMVKGDMDAYFIDIPDPDLYRKIKQEPTLAYDFSFGLYYELTFNPATFKTGEFNPFTNPRIREAINYIVDRNYIVNEIMGGLATPKFLPIIKCFQRERDMPMNMQR